MTRMWRLIPATILSLAALTATAAGPDEPAEPTNALERRLLAAQKGEAPIGDFLERLVDAEVVLLSKRDVVETRDPGDIPALVIPGGEDGGEMLAVFTSPQLAYRVAETYPEYRYGVRTEFLWVLAHTAPGLGVAINPGWTLGMKIPSYGLLRLRERYQDRIDELSEAP